MLGESLADPVTYVPSTHPTRAFNYYIVTVRYITPPFEKTLPLAFCLLLNCLLSYYSYLCYLLILVASGGAILIDLVPRGVLSRICVGGIASI